MEACTSSPKGLLKSFNFLQKKEGKRTCCTKFCMHYLLVKWLFRKTSSIKICSKTVKEQRFFASYEDNY